MKSTFAILLASLVLCATAGCRNGPIRNMMGSKQCDPCCAPSADPSFGAGYSETAYPVESPTYIDGVSGDPYIHGSNYGGATMSTPALNELSTPVYDSTIVPPDSSGSLPSPGPGG